MPSIFSRIITREIPAYIVAEDDFHMAILDINPVALGHVIVFPKKEVDYLFDLDDHSYQALMRFSKEVAMRLKEVVPCKRIGITVIGLEVPHVHVHLIPINAMDDMNFSKTKLSLDASVAENLISRFNNH